MDLGIEGRTAAVAAGTDGLGLASARALAAEGVRTVICGRDEGKLARALEELGGTTTGLVCDVSTAEGASRFVHEAAAELGSSPEILVANCGGPPLGDPLTFDIDAYRAALEMNLLGTIAMATASVPAMVERGWGRFVAITSIAAREPVARLALSNTARSGLTGFLKTLSDDVASAGVTVNSVLPGYHETARVVSNGDPGLVDSIPARRLGDPARFGQVVAFLCSEPAAYVTGTTVTVDGGVTRSIF